ncbi:acyl-CoA dehydrogenase family protein [Faecalibacter sp. LW9]|uniref:acyl-CoA dehydrogenase family protein n=1 Tax=Faecalibacter sp. LW9 TaxID=3103144 RepID=UPI003A4C66F4
MSSPYLMKHGSDFIKENYLMPTIAGDKVSAIAITEPGAGSDAANIRTTAKLEGDHYVVNGSKTFITNEIYGDYYVTVVKTDPEAGVKGVSLLLIDRESAGVTTTKIEKLGWHSSDTAEINFDNVKVPKENLLGKEGLGFIYLMGGLQLERLAGAIMGTAASECALNYALEYMNQREAFGRKINRFQVLRHRVAQMTADIEVTKNYVYYCAQLQNEGEYAVKECSIAKLQSTELSSRVINESLQFFGGYGFTEEFKIARMYRDTRVGTIGGRSSEIMREIISKMVIDDISYNTVNNSKPAGNSVPKTTNNNTTNTNQEKNTTMSDLNLLDVIKTNAEKASAIGNSLKFDLGGEVIVIDGKGGANVVSQDDQDADCTLKVSKEDLADLLSGKLNPMNAVMGGKVQIKGDMGVAMKLQSLLG